MKKYILILLILSACSPEILVRSDFDKDVNIEQYTTYKWAPIREIEANANPLYYNQLTNRRVQTSVNKQLASRGFSMLEDSADLILHYHIIVQDQTMLQTDPYGYYGPYWMRPQRLVRYKEGTLIIDIMEASTNKLAWRGWATSAIDNSGTMDAEQIDESIRAIFNAFHFNAKKKDVNL